MDIVEFIETVKHLFEAHGLIALLIIFIYLLIFQSTNVKVVVSYFFRLIAWIGKAPARVYVSWDISARITRASKKQELKI